MAIDRPYEDAGRRAWERLAEWRRDRNHEDDSEGALGALDDIGHLRHLLDQDELAAVRTARRHGRSWAEIATNLGITRQSAWERWRDMDETPDASAGDAKRPPEIATPAATRLGQSPKRLVRVPDLVGLSWNHARERLLRSGLEADSPDSDDPSLTSADGPEDTVVRQYVVRQYPEPGSRVPRHSSVRLWFGRGGGSAGVREPRRPNPPRPALAAELDEAAERFG